MPGETYYEKGNTDRAVATTLTIKKLEKRRQLTSQWTCSNDRLVIVLVGLPGRGKSFLCRKLQAFFTWRGEECQVFNVGKYRRFAAAGDDKQDANFFDSSNEEASRVREEVAMIALDDLLSWVDGGVSTSKNRTAIFDATNTTRARRTAILDKATTFQQGRQPIGIVFLESICDDEELLIENFRYKISTSPDFNGMTEEAALQDLLGREQKYKDRYEPIEDDSLSYVKIYNFSSKVLSNQIYGSLSKLLVPALMSWHVGDRPIFLCRSGKAFGVDPNKEGCRMSGGSPRPCQNTRRSVLQGQGLGVQGASFRDALCDFVTNEGIKFMARQLHAKRHSYTGTGTSLTGPTDSARSSNSVRLILEEVKGKQGKTGEDTTKQSASSFSSFPCFVMTSTMPRAIQTVTWQDSKLPLLAIRQSSALNPLDKGDFAGMDLEEIKAEAPEWFEQMENDPFRTRFPGGESYEDIVTRLETTIIDIEQQVAPVLVVSHLHVIQVLLAYFLNTFIEECSSIDVPHNTIVQISPLRGGGWTETRHELIHEGSDGESSDDEDDHAALSAIKSAMWGMSVRPSW